VNDYGFACPRFAREDIKALSERHLNFVNDGKISDKQLSQHLPHLRQQNSLGDFCQLAIYRTNEGMIKGLVDEADALERPEADEGFPD